MKTFVLLLCVLISISTVFGQSPIKRIYYGAYSGGEAALTDNGVLHYVAKSGAYYQTEISTKKISRMKSKINGYNITFSPNGKYAVSMYGVANQFKATLYDIEHQHSYTFPDFIYYNQYFKENYYQFSNNSSLLVISSWIRINNQDYKQYKYYDTQTGMLKRTVIDSVKYSSYFSSYSANNYYGAQFVVSSDFRYLLQYKVGQVSNVPSLITVYDIETNTIAVRTAPSSLNLCIPSTLSVTDTNHFSASFIQNTSNGRSYTEYNVFGSTSFDMSTSTIQLPQEPFTNTNNYHSILLPKKKLNLSWFANSYVTNTLRVFNLGTKQYDSVAFDFYFFNVIASPDESTLGFITYNGIYTYNTSTLSTPTRIFPEAYFGPVFIYNEKTQVQYCSKNNTERLAWSSLYSSLQIVDSGIVRYPFCIQSISTDGIKYATQTHIKSFNDSQSTQFGSTYVTQWSAFSQENTKLFYHNGNYLRRFDITTESVDALYKTTTDGSIKSVDITDDKTLIAGALPDYTTAIWNVNEPNNPKYVYGHYSEVTQIKFAHNNSILATVGNDSTLRFWDINTSTQLRKVKTGGVTAMVFSRNNDYLLTTHSDTTLRVWDVRNGKLLRSYKEYDDNLLSIDISADGQTVATSAADGSIILWDAQALGLFDVVGVDDNNISEEPAITVFPNPCTTDILQFSISGNTQLHSIRVVNSVGDIVMQELQPQQPIINVQQLPSGNYYAILQSSTSVVRVPFVVVH
ncbi:MAG: T9SS type A sorting domain-containing protein [Bacteriodetes bacterium]|nr:T9SS type A sorting domain-containing protein [Bacteroidota bacterium]